MANLFSTKWQQLKSNLSIITSIGLLKEARTRIMLMYALLMLFMAVTAIPVIQNRVYQRVRSRVLIDLEEDLEEFENEFIESLLDYKFKSNAQKVTSNIIAEQRVYQVIDEIFDTIVTEDDNFLVAIVDKQFYKSSSNLLIEELTPGSLYIEKWQNIEEEESGEIKLDNPSTGNIIYDAEPIKTTEQTLGVIVAVHTTAGEQQEAVESLDVIIETLIAIIAISLALAWLTTGKILAPLRKLTNTAKVINEANLNRRFDARGDGELAELAKTFNGMMGRIESAFITQRNFINDAGHELRTPITIIRGHLELLEIINADSLARQETISLVLDELDRMNRLVNDLILLARAERHDFLQIETIELTSFVAELFNKLQRLGERNWHLDNQILSGTMMGDRQRITQAIINLANNAVQHTIVDSLIVFGAKFEGSNVEFWLRDTGNGIAASEQERIFDRFARVKNSRRRSEGSGLGLSIVKAVVEAHGGAINLQSKLGIGSTFTLIFRQEFNEQQDP
ncbi:MAG: ATP-binding protein [Cyanobacteria bacterium J06648_1]